LFSFSSLKQHLRGGHSLAAKESARQHTAAIAALLQFHCRLPCF